MINVIYIFAFFFSFSLQAACESVRFNEVQKKYGVVYDVSNIIVTSKGRTFFITYLLMSVSLKNSLLMATRQFHMHHPMDLNMLAI